jgi:hypothetical protein
MVNATPRRGNFFTSRTLVAYAVAFALAAAAVVLGFVLRSVPWLALGIWLAASLSVLLIDRAVNERTAHRGPALRESIGALFQGSPAALTVIGLMALAALAISFLVYW